MYYSLKTDCYFRRYENIGYITRPIVAKEEIINESGAIFVEQLTYSPQSLDDIVGRLSACFSNVSIEVLKQDVTSFYSDLVDDEFLNCSSTLYEFKESGFEYSTLKSRLTPEQFKYTAEETSSKFLESYFKKHPYLQTFHIELTSKCNERCIHCYIPHAEKNSEIEYTLMINTLHQCKKMGVLTVVFSGGEPLLHPHFCDFLRYAKDLDFNVTVLSNLTILNEEILSALTYKHACCVNVSLYSMLPSVHDSITTVPGSFEKTKFNILKLIANNVPVQINCPVMKQNKDSFCEVIKWGQNHKCSVNPDYLIIARSDRSTDNLNHRLSSGELKSVLSLLAENDIVFQTNIKEKRVNREDDGDVNGDSKVCGVGMSTLCMVATGEVYPCAGWQGYVCGNLKKETLQEIWESSPQVQYLRSLRLKDFEKCNGCDDFDYCLMCMSRNANEDPNGDIFNIPKITCEAAHIHHEVVEAYRKAHSIN